MKKLYSFMLFLSLSSFLFAQNGSSTETELVKQLVIDSFDEIWSNLDSEKIGGYHTDDFLLLEHGDVWNNDSIRNYHTKALQAQVIPERENTFDFIKVEKIGNSIWVAYQNYATWSIDDKIVGNAHWLESALAIKTDDGWKLQMLHSTRVENK